MLRSAVKSLRGGHSGAPLLAALVVAVSMVALWLALGVRADVIARFFGYECVYIVLPGWLIYGGIFPGQKSSFRRLVVGWPTGIVVNVFAFAFCAAIGVRDLFAFYPLFVIVPAAVLAIRRGRRGTATRTSDGATPPDGPPMPRWGWAVAAVCLFVLGLLVVAHYPSAPLPTEVSGTVVYPSDYVYQTAVTGEALHHWPLQQPNVAGTPLHYHWFSHAHMAGIAQITGIRVPDIVLVLYLVPLLMLLVCQTSYAGAFLGRNWWAGPLAALMIFFVGEFDLSPVFFDERPFWGMLPQFLHISPPFICGAVLFLPLLLLLCERFASSEQDFRQWLLFSVLAMGCAGAEVAILPLVGGGIGLYGALRWLKHRRIEATTVIAISIVLVVFTTMTYAIYGGPGAGLMLSFPGAISQASSVVTALTEVSSGLVARAVFWVIAVPAVLVLLFAAPLLGLWLDPRRGWRPAPEHGLALCIFAVGVVLMLAYKHDGYSQLYFPMYGLMAVIPISAGGLYRYLAAWWTGNERPGKWALAFLACWLVLLAAVILGALRYALGDIRAVDDPMNMPLKLFLALYGSFAVVLLVAWALTRTSSRRPKWAAFPVVGVLFASLLNVPMDYLPPVTSLKAAGLNTYVSAGNGLDPALRRDFDWITDHTQDDAVLAVSNFATFPARITAPTYMYTSAFTERRVFLEGPYYTDEAARIGYQKVGLGEAQPYPGRFELDRAAFYRADPAALRALRHSYGVTTLVVDRRNGKASPRLGKRVRLIHRGPALDVYDLSTIGGE